MAKLRAKSVAITDNTIAIVDEAGRVWAQTGGDHWVEIDLPEDPAAAHGQRPSFEHPMFAQFWELYPKKVGKPSARRAFNGKMKGLNDFAQAELWETLFDNLRQHAEKGDWKDRQYVPNPTTYLNQERYNDEVHKPTSARGSVRQTIGTDW